MSSDVIGVAKFTGRVNLTKLIEARNPKGAMSQKELALRLGVSPSQICSWENGERTIDGNVLKKWCALLGISLSEVVIDETESA